MEGEGSRGLTYTGICRGLGHYLSGMANGCWRPAAPNRPGQEEAAREIDSRACRAGSLMGSSVVSGGQTRVRIWCHTVQRSQTNSLISAWRLHTNLANGSAFGTVGEVRPRGPSAIDLRLDRYSTVCRRRTRCRRCACRREVVQTTSIAGDVCKSSWQWCARPAFTAASWLG